MPERTAFQSHISSLAAEALGIRPSALSARTEHMCASGTVGIRYAYAFVAAGLADLVMVLGVEKLNQPAGEEAILNMGAGVDRARALTDKPVWIRGTGQALDGFQLTSLHEDYAHWPALERAAQSAYRMAGVTAREVDVAEVHDCFAIAELIAYEELGFCRKGEAGPFLAPRQRDYRGAPGGEPRGGGSARGAPPRPPPVAPTPPGFAPPPAEARAPPRRHTAP